MWSLDIDSGVSRIGDGLCGSHGCYKRVCFVFTGPGVYSSIKKDTKGRSVRTRKKTKSIAVETDFSDLDGTASSIAVASGTKPRIPGRSVKIHEKLSSQRKMR